MTEPTETQIKVYDFIAERIGSGMPPTLREICEEFGWASHAAAAHHLLAMEKKGMIKRKTHLARHIQAVWNHK